MPSEPQGPDEQLTTVAIRLAHSLGFRMDASAVQDLALHLVYYAREVRFDERIFSLKVPPGLPPPEGHSWVPPEDALRTLMLSGHKRAVALLFPGVVPGGAQALDHMPVVHPSGTVFLCDFDGTVSDPEASLAILKRFAPGRWERYERPWMESEISTHDCLGYQFTMIDATVVDMGRFAADEVPLRKGFVEFVSWCRARGHGLVITSSGVDFYIKAILDRHGLGDVPFVADRTHVVPGLGNIAEEGFYNPDCDWCGNCKLELIKLYRARGAKVVYVGDGATDECPSVRADVLFARAGLLRFAKKEEVPAVPFETFLDVIDEYEKMSGR